MSLSTITHEELYAASKYDWQDIFVDMRSQLWELADLLDSKTDVLSVEFARELNYMTEAAVGMATNYQPNNTTMIEILSYIAETVTNLKTEHQRALELVNDPATLPMAQRIATQITWTLKQIIKPIRAQNPLREI